jgi:hypothetical protein
MEMSNSLQALVDAMNQSASDARGHYHLTLGQLVDKLGECYPEHFVIYDWVEQASPSKPESYRGYYCDLSFPPSSSPITVRQLLLFASSAIGETFEGYKGGDFAMHAKTPLWASPYGSSNGIAIMDVKVIGDRVVLITKQVD